MYKVASQLKLRFVTPKGNLTVEQLWDLKKSELAALAKELRAKIKEQTSLEDEELAFLEAGASKAHSEDVLRFNIIKDIYQSIVAAEQESATAAQKKLRNQRIMELIARKQEEELAGKSIEELQGMLE